MFFSLSPPILPVCHTPFFLYKTVPFSQSNFNADNCLVGGRTMDYGPFGFIERYDPKWGMW